MNIVKLSDAEPGKMLSEDVFNFQGLLLLKKETVLTEKNIRMLKSWGIHEIIIEGYSKKDVDLKSRTFNELITSIENELIKRIDDIENEPVMLEIIKTASGLLARTKNKNMNISANIARKPIDKF